jgi:hypothetical protein
MSDWKTANQGAELKSFCAVASRLVAAGAGDGTEVVAAGINRRGFGSAKLIIAAHCNNTAAQKLQLTSVKVAYAPDNGSGAPGSYGTDTQLLAANFDLVTGTGDNYGQFEQDLDFTGQDQWVRIKYTPDSTAGATDVAEVAAVLVCGGAQPGVTQPVTRSA